MQTIVTGVTAYGTVAEADVYLSYILGLSGVWALADATKRTQARVTSKTYIDRIRWIEGYKTEAQRDAELKFIQASYELAAMLIQNPALLTQQTSGKNIKVASADNGTFVEYFASTLGDTGPLPPNVYALLWAFIELKAPVDSMLYAGSGGSTGAVPYAESITRRYGCLLHPSGCSCDPALSWY